MSPQKLETFDIRNFHDRLEAAKEAGRYICPSCGGNNLTIGSETSSKPGAYQCWNGCSNEEIREAIRPWDEVLAQANGSSQRDSSSERRKQPCKLVKPASIPESISIAPCLSGERPKTQPAKLAGWDQQRVYKYGEDCKVIRFERSDPDQANGRSKTFRQYHRRDGEWAAGKGQAAWPAYRAKEAISATTEAMNTWLVLEGEDCVDTARSVLGMAAVTFQGSSWDKASLDAFCHQAAIAGATLAILPDNDRTGHKKADAVEAAANRCKVPCLRIEPLLIEPALPEAGDIVNMLELSTAPELSKRIAAEIERLAEAKRQTEREQDPAYLLRLEIADYLAETDAFARALRKNKICSEKRLPSQTFDQLCSQLQRDQGEHYQRPRMMSMAELFAMQSEAMEFVADGILPARDSALLTGLPGDGKTLLALDLAFSVSVGGEWMGERCKPGKVLILNSDQALGVTVSYLIDRGFRAEDDMIRVVGPSAESAGWDVRSMEQLEQWLEEFRPSLVILDSIRTLICYPMGIEEKSEMIGHWIAQVNSLVARYGGTTLWIHHDAKSKELSGVAKSSGSTAIVSNVSFHFQMQRVNTDPASPLRKFNVHKARRLEPFSAEIELQAADSSFKFIRRGGESEEVAAENQSLSDRILLLLSECPGIWLEGPEIRARLGTDSVYNTLRRITARGIISMCPTPGKRSKSYRVGTDEDVQTGTSTVHRDTELTDQNGQNPRSVCHFLQGDSPPPTHSQLDSLSSPETLSTQGLESTYTSTYTLLTPQSVSEGVSEGVSELKSPASKASDELLTVTYTQGGEGGKKTGTPQNRVTVEDEKAQKTDRGSFTESWIDFLEQAPKRDAQHHQSMFEAVTASLTEEQICPILEAVSPQGQQWWFSMLDSQEVAANA